jgi:hypothetical protein
MALNNVGIKRKEQQDVLVDEEDVAGPSTSRPRTTKQ